MRLGLKPSEFWELQPWQLFALLKGQHDKQIEAWQQTRLILASLTGKDPRYLVPLPGDFDDVPVMGTLPVEKMLKRAGLSKWLA